MKGEEPEGVLGSDHPASVAGGHREIMRTRTFQKKTFTNFMACSWQMIRRDPPPNPFMIFTLHGVLLARQVA
jgi:hypothetical protein